MGNYLYTLIIYPLEQLIELTFAFCIRVFKNQGISVLFVSVAVTLCCLPLYIVAERWQEIQRNIEEKLRPGTTRIKKAFKGDEQYMILTAFYKQNHYHPLMALRSSFSLLIQVPFFMAAYHFLSNLESLRGTSFLFIKDMGAPDAMFTIGSFTVNTLPIAMTLINCISGTIYSKGHGAREKIQIYGMAALFLVILYPSPAGLVFYWTMNNLFSLVKNIFYKMKNPLKALYICLLAFIALGVLYLLAFADGMFKKRLTLSFALVLLAFIPQYLKFISYMLNTWAKPVLENTKIRFTLFFVSAISLCLLCGYVIPSELVSSSVQEFSNIDSYSSPFYFLKNSLFQALGIFIVWPTCIYFLFGKRIKTLLSCGFALLLICGVVNTYAFPGDYGSLNNTLMFISDIHNDKTFLLLLNIAVILAVIVAVFAIIRYFTKYTSAISGLLCFIFAVISVINTSKISGDYKTYLKILSESDNVVSIEPRIHLSKTGKNVICFMLDAARSDYIDEILKEKPELNEAFDGFTFFKNTVSYNGHTIMSSPSLFGGYEYTPLEINKRNSKPLIQEDTESLLMLARIFSEQLGYKAFLADSPWANFSHIPDMRITNDYPLIEGANLMRKYTDIWKSEHPGTYDNSPVLSQNMKRNFLFISIFRCLPSVARSFTYDNGRWLGLSNIKDMNNMLLAYAVMDYLPQLTDFNNNDTKGYFAYIVNDMTHEGDLIAAPDYKFNQFAEFDKNAVYFKFGGYSGNISAYLHLAKWFSYLKSNGVYDNTRIIIVSDHGNGCAIDSFDKKTIDGSYTKDHLHPILFVKDFNEHGLLKHDMTFMTTADVPSLALKDLVNNPVNPFTGNPVNMDLKKNGAIVTISNNHQPVMQYKNRFNISDKDWYLVKDNIFDDANWSKYEK